MRFFFFLLLPLVSAEINYLWKKQFENNVRFLGTFETAFENSENKIVESILYSTRHILGSLDIYSGEDGWAADFSQDSPIRNLLKRENTLIVVSGQKVYNIDQYNIETSERTWSFSNPIQPTFFTDAIVNGESIHSDIQFLQVPIQKDRDNVKLDVIVLSHGQKVQRIDGIRGNELWYWNNDLGGTIFHRICVLKSLFYLIGSNSRPNHHEVAIIGLDPKTGVRQSTRYVPLGRDYDIKTFYTTLKSMDGYFVWLEKKSGEEDIIIYSLQRMRSFSLKELYPDFSSFECSSKIELKVLEFGDNSEYERLLIHCSSAETWVVEIIERGGVKVDVTIVPKPTDQVGPNSIILGQDFSSVPRLYLKKSRGKVFDMAVLEVFGIEKQEELINLEFNIEMMKLQKDEGLSSGYIKLQKGEKGVLNWTLFLCTNKFRWHTFSSNHTAVEQHQKTKKERPVVPVNKPQWYHDEL